MDRESLIKKVLIIFVSSIIYYQAINLLCNWLPYANQPNWWLEFWPTRSFGVMVWLSAMDIISALSAATVVALFLSIFKVKSVCIGATLGIFCGAYILLSSMHEYGISSSNSVILLFVQFIAVSAAMPVAIFVLTKQVTKNDALS